MAGLCALTWGLHTHRMRQGETSQLCTSVDKRPRGQRVLTVHRSLLGGQVPAHQYLYLSLHRCLYTTQVSF